MNVFSIIFAVMLILGCVAYISYTLYRIVADFKKKKVDKVNPDKDIAKDNNNKEV